MSHRHSEAGATQRTGTRECPYCGTTSRDGHLCHKCTRTTKRNLARIAELWPVLQETITRQDVLTPPSEVHADTVHAPLPYKAAAADVADRVRHRLVSWVRLAMDEHGAPCPPDLVPAMCHLLTAYAAQLRVRADAEEWADEIAASRDEIAGAVDLPAERAKVTAGPCPEHTDDDEPCPGVVIAIYPRDLPPRADCTATTPGTAVCGRTWPAKDWAHLGSRIAARRRQVDQQLARGKDPDAVTMAYLEPPAWMGARVYLTVPDAAVVCGVPVSTLYRWVAAGEVDTMLVPSTTSGGREVQVVDPAKVSRRHARAIEDLEGIDVETRRERVLDTTCTH